MSGIILGFSGGVDSAAAALRLLNAGENVTGLFLDTGVESAREDAVKTAEYLGMKLKIADARERLENNVCRPFIKGYLEGRTINPCLICNPTMKLKTLLEYADEVGAEYIATGHYAVSRDGALYEGDLENDQSYQLCLITPSQLKRLVLPLGGDKKSQIREEAARAGIPIADKPDSMDICFIPDHDYAAWLESRAVMPGAGKAYFHGEVAGTHAGIHRYTVGQRWDELREGRRLYVSEIRPETNSLNLALWEELFKTRVEAAGVNWLIDPPKAPFRARVRARHTRWEMPECTVTPAPQAILIECDEPLRAPAKGQTAAVYVDHRVVCAGEIV